MLQTPSKRRKKTRELRKRRSSVLERDIVNSTSLFAILRRIFRIRKHAESSRQRGALGDRVAARRGPLSLSTRYFCFLIENNRSSNERERKSVLFVHRYSPRINNTRINISRKLLFLSTIQFVEKFSFPNIFLRY